VAVRTLRRQTGARVKTLSGVARGTLRRWLGLANAATGLFLGLPFLAPLLLRQGRPDLANFIYSAYHVTCHEWPFRAYFLFGPQATYSAAELEARGIGSIFDFRGSPELGYKVAFCERNVAIYAAALPEPGCIACSTPLSKKVTTLPPECAGSFRHREFLGRWRRPQRRDF